MEPKTEKKTVKRQKDYPNLLAEGGHNRKWKTPEERIAACKRYCEYLRRGFSKCYYPEAREDTIKRYMDVYPNEFVKEKIEDAERAGLGRIESIGFDGMMGKVPGFSASTWIFITKNKLKAVYRDEVGIGGKDGQPLQLSVNAGSGFLPATLKIDGAPAGGNTAIPATIQGDGVAQESKEDDNSDSRDNQAGTS